MGLEERQCLHSNRIFSFQNILSSQVFYSKNKRNFTIDEYENGQLVHKCDGSNLWTCRGCNKMIDVNQFTYILCFLEGKWWKQKAWYHRSTCFYYTEVHPQEKVRVFDHNSSNCCCCIVDKNVVNTKKLKDMKVKVWAIEKAKKDTKNKRKIGAKTSSRKKSKNIRYTVYDLFQCIQCTSQYFTQNVPIQR